MLELQLHANAQHVAFITRGHLDEVLHEPPQEHSRQTIDRPRVIGTRLPTLQDVLQNPKTAWLKHTLDWCCEGERTLAYPLGAHS